MRMIEKPQYFRSAEDEFAKSDSVECQRCEAAGQAWLLTIDNHTKEVLERCALGRF